MACVALAGCSAEGPRETIEGGEEGGDGPRRSVGNGTDSPHDKVTFFEEALDLVGQDSREFQTQVPTDVTIVEFVVSGGGNEAFSGFQVGLSGCGTFSQG